MRAACRGLVVEDLHWPLALELGVEARRDAQASEDLAHTLQQLPVDGLDREAPPACGRTAVGVQIPGHKREPLRLGQVEHPGRNPLAERAGHEAVALHQVGQIDAVPGQGHAVGPLRRRGATHHAAHHVDQTGPGPVLAGHGEHNLGPAPSARVCVDRLDGAVAGEQAEEPHEFIGGGLPQRETSGPPALSSKALAVLVAAVEHGGRLGEFQLVGLAVVEARDRHDGLLQAVGSHVRQAVPAQLLRTRLVVSVGIERVVAGHPQPPRPHPNVAHRLLSGVALGRYPAPAQRAGGLVVRQHLVAGHHQLDGLGPAGCGHPRPLGQAADVAVDPLHVALGLHPGPLGDQVVDVVGPVLDGGVRHPGRAAHHDLHHRGVQRVGGVGGRRAALDVVDLGALVGDDQGALELAHVLGVDPEVGLQGRLHLHARRHVDERPARPHRGVECRELVVVGRDDRPEVPLEQLRVLPQGGVHVAEQHPLGLEVLAVAVVDDLALVLRGHAGQVLALGLGDAEALVGVLDRLGHHVPVVGQRVGRLDVVVDVVEVDAGGVTAPGRAGPALEAAVRLETEVEHPLGFALEPRHLGDDVVVEALLGLEDVVLLVAPAELVAAEVDANVRSSHPLTSRWNLLLPTLTARCDDPIARTPAGVADSGRGPFFLPSMCSNAAVSGNIA